MQQLSIDRASGTRHRFDILSRTAGNDTLAAGLGPDNNLNPSEIITVDNIDSICKPGRERNGIRTPLIDKYYAMVRVPRF